MRKRGGVINERRTKESGDDTNEKEVEMEEGKHVFLYTAISPREN